uniref:FAM192A_Fyv6_N domain-containing protein n=1 Tax=Panagrellus redivivus TaxID=6233 RepID=A0A7E4ZTH3_PANRE
MNFVSEEQLKVENANKPEEPEYDPRPLYERLKAVRDKAQEEYEETHALKNQFRGLDEDETDFLDKVQQVKADHERAKKKEEKDILAQCARAAAAALTSEISSTYLKPKPSTSTAPSAPKSKDLLKKMVVKRKAESTPSSDDAGSSKVAKIVEPVTPKAEEKPASPEKKATTSPVPKKALLTGYALSSDEEDT